MSDLNIDAKAISDSLKSTLGDWKDSVKDDVVGYVSAIADGVARVKGLENVMASELLEFPGGLVGVALNLEEDLSFKHLLLLKDNLLVNLYKQVLKLLTP